MIDIKVPAVGESISEVTLLKWVKGDGEYVNRDEVIAELESEKATFELNAEEQGQLQTKAQEGDVLKIGDVIAVINSDVAAPAAEAAKPAPVAQAPQQKTETITVQKPAEVKPAAQSSAAPVTVVSN